MSKILQQQESVCGTDTKSKTAPMFMIIKKQVTYYNTYVILIVLDNNGAGIWHERITSIALWLHIQNLLVSSVLIFLVFFVKFVNGKTHVNVSRHGDTHCCKTSPHSTNYDNEANLGRSNEALIYLDS